MNEEGLSSINEEMVTPEVGMELMRVAALPQSMPCLDLLIAENYIPDEYNAHGEIDDFIHLLLTLKNSGMYTAHMDDGYIATIYRILLQAIMKTTQIITALEKRLAGDKVFEL